MQRLVLVLLLSLATAQHEEADPAHTVKESAVAKKVVALDEQAQTNGFQVVKDEVFAVVTTEKYQWVVALITLPLSVIALVSGPKFFQVLVAVAVAAASYTLVLSQLGEVWSGNDASLAKYVASTEVALVMGVATYWGWEGAQLLFGATLGMYIFSLLNGWHFLAGPVAQRDRDSTAMHVVLGSLCVGAGVYGLHPKYGGARLLGVVCSVFGASLFVAVSGYFVMLALTDPAVANANHMSLLPQADVPAVIDFWFMIISPFTSKGVGFFTYTGRTFDIGNQQINLDKASSLFFFLIISLTSMCTQWKADARRRKAKKSLDEPLLA